MRSLKVKFVTIPPYKRAMNYFNQQRRREKLAAGSNVEKVIKKARKKRTEAELLKGVTPRMCGPDLVPDRVGKELI